MRRQRQVAMANAIQKPSALLLTQLRTLRQQAINPRLHLRVIPLRLAFAHHSIPRQVTILPNAGRVIHQAHHHHTRMIRHGIKRGRHVARRQFAA